MVVRESMSDVDEEPKRPLTLRPGGTLGLNRPSEPGQVKQSFSHGRSKVVAVEVRKKRIIMPGAAAPEPAKPEPGAAPAVARAPLTMQPSATPAPVEAETPRPVVPLPPSTTPAHRTRTLPP